MSLAAAGWTAIAVVALLISEKAPSRLGVWLAKPAASVGFVAVGWFQAGSSDAYSSRMLGALVACALGDVLLIRLGRGATFLAGLGAFAIGHALYACAFWTLRPEPWATGATACGMLAIAWFTLRWLDPHLDRPLAWAVRGYIAIIGAMVTLAVGASAVSGDIRPALGALAFAASDLSVARERFVRPGFNNLLWGLPLYYAAQVLLAWTVL